MSMMKKVSALTVLMVASTVFSQGRFQDIAALPDLQSLHEYGTRQIQVLVAGQEAHINLETQGSWHERFEKYFTAALDIIVRKKDGLGDVRAELLQLQMDLRDRSCFLTGLTSCVTDCGDPTYRATRHIYELQAKAYQDALDKKRRAQKLLVPGEASYQALQKEIESLSKYLALFEDWRDAKPFKIKPNKFWSNKCAYRVLADARLTKDDQPSKFAPLALGICTMEQEDQAQAPAFRAFWEKLHHFIAKLPVAAGSPPVSPDRSRAGTPESHVSR